MIGSAIKKLINTAIKVNAEDMHHVFVSISPHVNLIAFHIYYNKWEEGARSDIENIYYDDPESINGTQIRNLLTKLNKLKIKI